MEQKEKIEKPAWVESVEKLPEIVRQQVGTTCASVLSSLIQIYLLSPGLFSNILDEANSMICEYQVNE